MENEKVSKMRRTMGLAGLCVCIWVWGGLAAGLTFYVWPPAASETEAVVSVGSDLVRLNDVANFDARGLTFEDGRGCALRIDGGSEVSVLGCTIRNMGGSGVEIRKGERHRVAGCELAHLGNGGIGVYAGDPATLTPSGHVIDNNHIYDYARYCLTYGAAGVWVVGNLFVRIAEGVSLSAVDNVVGNNLFVDCQPALSGWQTWVTPESFVPPKGVHAQMPEGLLALPVDAAPWKDRYPELALLRDAVRDRTLRAPETRTRVERNVIWGGAQGWMVHAKAYPYTTDAWMVTNNLTGIDPLFVDAAKGDYHLRADSPAFKIGFRPLPLDKMGLYASAERAIGPSNMRFVWCVQV